MTKGYNAEPLIPPDTRYKDINTDWRDGIAFNGAYFPEDLRNYYLSESNNVLDDKVAYDPSISSLMDVGLIRDSVYSSDKIPTGATTATRNHQYYNVAAYVTGSEKTTIAASILGLESYPTNRAYKPDVSFDGRLNVMLPALQNISILRTETAVKQVEIIDPTAYSRYDKNTTELHSGLLVRTGSDISMHRWSYQDEGLKNVMEGRLQSTIKVENTIRLPLKMGVSDAVVHCTTTRSQCNWMALIRGSGALTTYTFRPAGDFVFMKCPPLREGESYSKWHRVRDMDQYTNYSITPTALLVGNRKALMLYDAKNNQYISNLIPDINRNTTCLRDFLPASGRYLHYGRQTGAVRNSSADHQYFVLTSDKVLWLDIRNPRKPILSTEHNMDSRDPSLQLAMSYLPEKELHVATVYSQMAPLTTVLEFGYERPPRPPMWYNDDQEKAKDFETLPISARNPQIFSTDPSKRTQALRVFELHAKTVETAEGMENLPTMVGALQYTIDHGLYSHILSSDPTVELDLHDKKQRKHPLHEIMLSRGLDDPADTSKSVEYHNFRRLYKRLCDYRRLMANTTDDEAVVARLILDAATKELDPDSGSQAKSIITAFPDYASKLGFDLATSLSGIKSILEHLNILTLDGPDNFKVKNMLPSLIDSTTVESIEEFYKYLKLIWLKPLKGFAPSRELEKRVAASSNNRSKSKGLFVLPHPRLASYMKARSLVAKKKQKVKAKATKPRDDDESNSESDGGSPSIKQEMVEATNGISIKHDSWASRKWIRQKRIGPPIPRRSVVFKKNHHQSFIEQRKNIVEHIATQVYMACLATQIDDDFQPAGDRYLDPVRKYAKKLTAQSLSSSARAILEDWTIGGEDVQIEIDDSDDEDATQRDESVFAQSREPSYMDPRGSWGTPTPIPRLSTPAAARRRKSAYFSQSSQLQSSVEETPPPMMSQVPSMSQLDGSQRRRKSGKVQSSSQVRKRRKTTEGF